MSSKTLSAEGFSEIKDLCIRMAALSVQGKSASLIIGLTEEYLKFVGNDADSKNKMRALEAAFSAESGSGCVEIAQAIYDRFYAESQR